MTAAGICSTRRLTRDASTLRCVAHRGRNRRHCRRPAQVSDEEFFQTLACSPLFPRSMPIHDDSLRFVNWWGGGASPAVIPRFRAVAAANSGALFGRKFSSASKEGKEGMEWVQAYLSDTSKVVL